MTVRERERYWREAVGRQARSGLSVKAFCEQEDLCAHTLYIWRRRLAEQAPVDFAVVRVRPERAVSNAAIELVLPSGERLQVAPGIDEATLRTVLTVLRERV
jgi:transposase-like protein